uniref:Murine leukemia virus integrase C-terminal domain-containing protein n=1 Tax=Knipowitschia caucasica TaxID=637954 RepID=A0AAV2K2X6_KNICA
MRKTLETREVKDTNKLPVDTVSSQDKTVKPGDHVFIKVIKRKSWNSPRWEGPHVVTLSTPTAVKVEGRTTWINLSHCKLRDITTLLDTKGE